MQTSSAIFITFTLYLLGILAIGWYAYLKTQNVTDYFLGGRNLPPWVAALSAGASDTSGWLLMGLPGYAYIAGLEAAWIALGLCTGIALSWATIARRLRVFSYELDNTLTLPTYFQRRFQDNQPWLRAICAVFILLFFLFYVSAGLIGGAKLFNTVFGVPYHWAIWLGVFAVVSYTLFGGFLAVSWTDVFQGLLITAALVVVPVMVISQSGGFGEGLQSVARENTHFLNIWTDKNGNALGWIAIVSLIGWGLGYFGQPHILARYKAVRSPNDVPVAGGIALSWSLLVYTAAVLMGILGAIYLPETLADSEKVFLVLVEALFHPVIAGILLAAILAAIMSTADSQLLVSSSALAEDIYPLLMKKPLSPEASVQVGRLAVSGLAVLAALFALDPNSAVLEVVAYAWAGLGAAFGPALLLSLFWPRMNRVGAFAGVTVGGLTVVVWGQLSGGLFDLYELVPGFLLSTLAVLIASLMSSPPSAEVSEKFYQMTDKLHP